MEVCHFAKNCHNFFSLTPLGLENIDPRSPKLLTLKFTGVPFHLPSLVTLALTEPEIAGRGRICPPPLSRARDSQTFPVRVLSLYGTNNLTLFVATERLRPNSLRCVCEPWECSSPLSSLSAWLLCHAHVYSGLVAGAFHDRSPTPDDLISPILIKFGERGYLACRKHWSQS